MDPITEIRARVDILDLVRGYVEVKKVGRSYKALCPFHREKTPSFIISPEKQIAHCFGCGKGGDVFKFIMEVERVDFSEALHILADRAHIELKGMSPEKKDEKDKIYEVNQMAVEFFRRQLQEKGEVAQKYLEQRGFKAETLAEFNFGYAPDSFETTYQYLISKGFNKQEIVQAGLAVAKDVKTTEIYDRFRHRLVLPIRNLRGETVGFTARLLDAQAKEAKYINTPETPLFHKGELIFNLDRAKEEIKKQDAVIITEGNLDAVTAWEFGIGNVVCTSGTALGPMQVKLLKRFTENFLFCFDADEAGIQATKRNLEVCFAGDVSPRVVVLPEKMGKDPDECLRKDSASFKQALAGAVHYLDFYFAEIKGRLNPLFLENKKKITQELLPVFRKISNAVERDLALEKLAEFLQIRREPLIVELQKIKAENLEPKTETTPLVRNHSRAEILVGLLVEYPDLLKLTLEKISDLILTDDFLNRCLKELQAKNKLEDLTEEEEQKIKILGLMIEDKYGKFGQDALVQEVDRLIGGIQKETLLQKRQSLIEELKNCAEDTEKSRQILEEYSRLIRSGDKVTES